MKHLAGWADAHYLLLAPHNVCGPVGTMANVHFAVATPNYKVLEHFNDFADPWVQDLVDHAPRVSADDGCFGLPDRPGLGVRLNHEACARAPPHRRPAASVRGGLGKAGHSLTSRRRRFGLTRTHRSATQRTQRVPSVSNSRPRGNPAVSLSEVVTAAPQRTPDRSAASIVPPRIRTAM